MQRLYILLISLLSLFALSCESFDEIEYEYYGTCESIIGTISDQLGKTGQAGIVFYDKGFYSDGWRYLEAAPSDYEFVAQWAESWWGAPYVETKTAIGTGKKNTEEIIKVLTEDGQKGMAAQLCARLDIDGYNDWFLPSRDELMAMRYNLHIRGVGGFRNNTYHSSSQYSSSSSWYVSFGFGFYFESFVSSNARVRAIRAF